MCTVYTIGEYITTYSGAVLAKAKKKPYPIQVLLTLNSMPQARVLILRGHLCISHFWGERADNIDNVLLKRLADLPTVKVYNVIMDEVRTNLPSEGFIVYLSMVPEFHVKDCPI